MQYLFFSFPIVLGIIAGILWPYKAVEWIQFSNLILILLVFVNGLMTDWAQLFKWSPSKFKEHAIYIFALYILFPVILINLAFIFLRDQNYLLGFIFCCISPTAFVAPYFSRLRGGRNDTSVLHVALSTVLFPIVAFLCMALFFTRHLYVDISSVTRLAFTVTLVPLILSYFASRIFRTLTHHVMRYQRWLNPLLLAVLMFILCGSSFYKVRLTHFSESQMIFVLVLLLFLDFGIYWIARWLFHPNTASGETLSVSISLRNLAIPAGLLLSLQPKAALVPCLGLIVHSLYFQWLQSTAANRKKNIEA